MSGFSLLNFPVLVLKPTFEMMDRSDMISLSSCSHRTWHIINKTAKLVTFDSISIEDRGTMDPLDMTELLRLEIQNISKEFFKTHSVSIDAKVLGNPAIHVDISDSKKPFRLSFYSKHLKQIDKVEGTNGFMNIGYHRIPVKVRSGKEKSEVEAFWNSSYEGFRILVEYLKKIFKKPVRHFFIDTNCISNEKFKFIMDTVPSVQLRYNILAKRKDTFKHYLPIKSSYFKLRHASWFTLFNLLNADCQFIHLEISKLTNQDMGVYLRRWLAGSIPKLIRITVEMQQSLNIWFILSELPGYSQRMEIPINYTVIHEKDYVLIKRKDGVVVKILVPSNRTTKQFDMCVWGSSHY